MTPPIYSSIHCIAMLINFTALRHSNSKKLHFKSPFLLNKPVCNEIFISIPWLSAPKILLLEATASLKAAMCMHKTFTNNI